MYISFPIFLLGIILIVGNKKIGAKVLKFHKPGMKLFFGRLSDFESPFILKLYSWSMIFVGIILVLFAYASYFGPIIY